jgi:hypothetical protein
MEDGDVFYGHLLYLEAILFILWPFGIFYANLGMHFPVLVCCTKKNLATLYETSDKNN